MASTSIESSSSSSSKQEMDTTEQLYKTAQHYIGQVIELLSTTITKDEYLQHTSTRSAGSTLGKHLRHLHDHYRLLLDAIPASNDSPSSDDTLNVNYDVRLRNGDAENRHDACVESFVYLRERMKKDTKEGKGIESSRPVKLTAIIPEKVVVESTFGRELWFASFHAVHHFALIRVILGELDLKVSDDFGVAPATLVHRHELTPKSKM